MEKEFVHLHNHSEYSLLDGACKIDSMVEWAVKKSAPAVALTDHGNLFGAWDLYTKAREAGVKPILGCEVYVAPSHRKVKNKDEGSPYHLTLLAENATGYQNLIRLVSLGYTEGFYSKPRVDMEILRTHREGIIALTGCIAGYVPKVTTNREKALANFEMLIDVVGKGNLYAEVQNHYILEEQKAYPIIQELAEAYSIPLVGTNDCHYLYSTDHRMHDILLCIQMKKVVSDPDRMRFDNHFHFKSYDEMKQALAQYPESAFTNTVEIANRCNVELDYGDNLMPEYEVPDGYDNDSYLRKLCYEGLQKKLGGLSTNVKERIDYELEIIKQTGYAGYFLVVWDYVRFSHENGYPLSARGSGGSSLALYALDIITFNPMDYGCIFERFLNTERVSPPDIDIDFSDRARDFVIQYLVDKYGQDSVGKVATFSTLSAKAAITDVGRAMEIPIDDIKAITKLIPESANKITLEEVMEQVPEFRLQTKKPENRELMDLAFKVEGMKRHVSCHASAIVVSNGPLTDYVPLFKDKNDQVASQFEGKAVEEIGIVKFDSLGVRSLTKVYDCLKFIKENRGVELTLETLPFDDEKTYELINAGLIEGLFQLETSPGMKRVVTELQPSNFEEFSAIPALYRPGPLKSGMMQQFINRKNGLEEVKYLDPLLKDALVNTYGVCVYQEQVMQIARDLAGFTMSEADVLRSAMGKKDKEKLLKQRDKFVEGAVENGISAEKAHSIFDLLEPFGTYAFNKSHTVAYSILSYRMAYLKTHYPHEFMAAIMSGESGSPEKIMRYRHECELLNDFLGVDIEILPPDINHSLSTFSVSGDSVRFGLSVIKNVGDTALDEIIKAQKDGPFRSMQDFCERVSHKAVSKKTMECLIVSGALDSINPNRAELFGNIERMMKITKSSREDKDMGQMSLFESFGEADTSQPAVVKLDAFEEWMPLEKLKREKEQLGFYVSGHPLEQYKNIVTYFTTHNSETLVNANLKETVYLVAIVTSLREFNTKKGEIMASLTLEDLEGTYEGVMFPNNYRKYNPILKEGSIFWIKGAVDSKMRRRKGDTKEERQIILNQVEPISSVVENQTSDLEVFIPQADLENLEKLQKLQAIARESQGKNSLILHLKTSQSDSVVAQSGSDYCVEYSDKIRNEIESIFGPNSVFPSNRSKRVVKREYI